MEHLWSPWRMNYISDTTPPDGCFFCEALKQEDSAQTLLVERAEHAFVILNRYPYTSGHLMVVPYAHVPSIDQLTPECRAEIMELLNRAIAVLTAVYKPEGFNMGANIGAIAGAGVPGHVHFHIVPRWAGDTNFMTAVAQTRVLPEALEQTYQRLYDAWHQKP